LSAHRLVSFAEVYMFAAASVGFENSVLHIGERYFSVAKNSRI